MKSIRDVFKVGRGPSSSHTMGPEKAARIFCAEHPQAERFLVILRGSLAKTGKGHQTDVAIESAFAPRSCEVVFCMDTEELPHPNTMDFYSISGDAHKDHMRVYSIGGGDIEIQGHDTGAETPEIYPLHTCSSIAAHCMAHNIRLSDYVCQQEGEEIWDFLFGIWNAMKDSISQGMATRGILPGGLDVERKAQMLYNHRHIDESAETRENRMVCAYAFAASEQNASGGQIVTAPTCGACAVLPSVLLYMQQKKGFTDKQVLHALAVAGLIGELVKHNASVSGAQCGCQAEIGTACSMAAAALAQLHDLGIDQIEYAAEVALEHHLGLTCDPICGLVQIPCIERNAVAAMRAINALSLANFLTGTRKISFDLVVRTMYETGLDMSKHYRETSEGGLAKLY